jgi:hypothetical protein
MNDVKVWNKLKFFKYIECIEIKITFAENRLQKQEICIGP